MSMITIKHAKDECNREVVEYLDTDDLNDEDYYKFRELERNGKIGESIQFIKDKLLT